MDTIFDVDVEMGHLSGKNLEGALMDEYDFVDDDYYGRPQADAPGPTQGGRTKSTDREGVPVDPSYDGRTKSKKYDGAIFQSRKVHIENILLFTGLFSATVTLFIIESYKKPSLDEQTVALIHQLTGTPRDTPLDLPPFPDSLPFIPNPPAFRASTLWFLSLGLHIACAIWAIRWQRYTDLLGQSGESHRRARVRIYLSSSVGRRDMVHTVDVIWVLLHTSVFLFFIGLIDFLLLINKTVACIVLGCIVPLALAYIATTLLLHFFPNSQHFTPSSSRSWKAPQLDDQHPRSQSPFRRPPSGYIGEKSLRDDREDRDRQSASGA